MPKNKIIFYVSSTLEQGLWRWIYCFLSSLDIPCIIKGISEAGKLGKNFRKESIEIFYITLNDDILLKKDLSGYAVVGYEVNNIPAGIKLVNEKEDTKEIIVEKLLKIIKERLGTKKNINSFKKNLGFTIDLEIDKSSRLNELEKFFEYLGDKNIRITIFLTGKTINVLKNKGRLFHMISKHEIGNHTYDHKEPCRENIVKNHKLIKDIFGVEPCVFRSPRLRINKYIFSVLKRVRYSVDSSLFGIRPFPVLSNGESLCINEVPLLDAGDYYFLYKQKIAFKNYIEYLDKRLYQLGSFNTGFTLLFHYQYSGYPVWKKTIDTVLLNGYVLRTVSEMSDEYKASLYDNKYH